MTLKIQNFLHSYPGYDLDIILEKLVYLHNVIHKRHVRFNNLILFKYKDIITPLSGLAKECRGIILDERNNWSIVSRSFDKFYNFGETSAPTIDWESAVVQEKLDGSLCVMYYYNNGWHVNTSGSPDASGNVHNSVEYNFDKLFWETFVNNKFNLPPSTLKDFCFSFELTSQHNRIVVQHEESKLTLIGIRNRVTGQELSVNHPPVAYCEQLNEVCFSWLNYPIVKHYSLKSYYEIQAVFRNINPLKQEGFVVYDKWFNRVKIKHPGYVALHHLKSEMSTKRILEVIRSSKEKSEVLTYFPEFTKEFNEVEAEYDLLCGEIQNDFDRIKHIKEQKDFAAEAIKSRCSSALFSLRSSKKTNSVDEFFSTYNIHSLMNLMGLRK